jgi:hypothetical protein
LTGCGEDGPATASTGDAGGLAGAGAAGAGGSAASGGSSSGPLHVIEAEPQRLGDPTLGYTTLLGYGNTGHPFGDELSEDERAAVIEYLKTL